MPIRLLVICLLLCSFLPVEAQWDDEGWGAERMYTMTRKELKAKMKAEREKREGPDTTRVNRKWEAISELTTAIRWGDRLPFYTTANSYGVLSPEHSQGYARVSGKYTAEYKRWTAEYGADIIGYASGKSDYYAHNFHIQQLYAKYSYGIYRIVLGKKETPGEFVDPVLSSGNMVFSGNARPGIGFDIGMDDFSHMVIVNEFLEGKFNISWQGLTDGHFSKTFFREYADAQMEMEPPARRGRQRSCVQNAWIHHKSAFLRTKSSYPFFLTAGIEHAAMYAGTVNGHNNRQKGGWFMAAFGSKGKKPDGYNHLISYDFRGDVNLENWDLGVYKQHYSDDMEGGLFESGKDGLWGLEVRLSFLPWLDHIVIEKLYTTNQNGVVYANDKYPYTGEFQKEAGNSNFYHDEAYGPWANYYMGIGNPLLMSPIYNDDHYPDYSSNMIEALHIGISGKICQKVGYLLKMHWQESWGSPFAPFLQTRKNASYFLEADYSYKNFQFLPSFAFDKGDLMGDNIGFRLKVRYHL